MLQEQNKLERQQHMQEQKRISAEAKSDLQSANTTVNGSSTDHLDDFVARIDKLRQVSVCN